MLLEKIAEAYRTGIRYAPEALHVIGSGMCFYSAAGAGGPWYNPGSVFNVAVAGLLLSDVLEETPLPYHFPDTRFKGLLLKAMRAGVKYKLTFASAAAYASLSYSIQNIDDAAKVMGWFAGGMALAGLGAWWKRRRAKKLEALVEND